MIPYDLTKIREISIASMLGCNANRRQMVRCPFHSDKTPSFILYPDNSFHCFGCGKYGQGAIDFCVAMGYTFKESIEELSKYL